jgi:hypothetical protein
MTNITPQQMHEAADRLFEVDSDDAAISEAIYVLRTVADQVEARDAFNALHAMGVIE